MNMTVAAIWHTPRAYGVLKWESLQDSAARPIAMESGYALHTGFVLTLPETHSTNAQYIDICNALQVGWAGA